jgi:hypothetical protein
MLGADPLSRAASLEALHAYPGMLVWWHHLFLFCFMFASTYLF